MVRDEYLRNVLSENWKGYRYDNPNGKDCQGLREVVETMFDYPFGCRIVNS